jgi:ribose 1,5-bisphosphate isomerase
MSDVEIEVNPPGLPKQAERQLEQMYRPGNLGASRFIRQSSDLFRLVVEGWEGDDGRELVEALLDTGDYISATRGRNTPAVSNAVRVMLRGLRELRLVSVAEVAQHVHANHEAFVAEAQAIVERVAECGANLLAACDTILAFDYSSSQMAILRRLAEGGQLKHLIVPESRTLDGGRPIADEATALGFGVRFIADMAFAQFMPQVDTVLSGAETIFADGSCWNTVGSLAIAAFAAHQHIPYYVATDLMKMDPRSFEGVRRLPRPHDFAALLGYPGSFLYPDRISVEASDLDEIPPSLITSFITQEGILAPEHLGEQARQFLQLIDVLES